LSQVKFSQLSYTYPNAVRMALRAVSLEIQAGSFNLVIGESGSGKSTLLRCLNGLVPHFTGGAITGNLVVEGLNPVAEGPSRMALVVGMVFQDPEAQFVLDRVEDEIAFALENAAVPRAEMRTRVQEALVQMEIESLKGRKISSLSGGEQQRVAIAAALVLRPRILVLDEPTSQLDPESADEVMNALSRLNREGGLTIVLAEHRVERVLPWVEQVISVAHGEVISGAPRDVLMQTDLVPPVVALGKALHWTPMPVSVDEATPFAHGLHHGPTEHLVQAATKGTRLVVKDLRARYDAQEVLHGANLTVNGGEIAVLMGRNGAGKSTLMKCILGLVKPTSGDVSINGESVAGRDTADICRDVAYLPQNPNSLLFAETVAQELDITLANHGMSGKRDVQAVLRQLGLERYVDDYPRDLSVGERERVAIGAVTVTEPSVMLLDEPTRGLDYTAKRALGALLARWKEQGAAVLIVTHDVEFVAECADRVIILSEGNVVADGLAHDVLSTAPVFMPQIAQLFPGSGWLTVQDALHGMQVTS
jgi:energy-coupling factor transport system ATP-binding protein